MIAEIFSCSFTSSVKLNPADNEERGAKDEEIFVVASSKTFSSQ